MGDLADYGIDLDTLRRMYEEWKQGVPKSTLEASCLRRTSSHGRCSARSSVRTSASKQSGGARLARRTNGSGPLEVHNPKLRGTQRVAIGQLSAASRRSL